MAHIHHADTEGFISVSQVGLDCTLTNRRIFYYSNAFQIFHQFMNEWILKSRIVIIDNIRELKLQLYLQLLVSVDVTVSLMVVLLV